MTARPILFSGEMVRAILDERKTQTRRVAYIPTDAKDVAHWSPPSGKNEPGYANHGVNYWTDSGNHIDPCPYGQPGDLLWVRETWRVGAWDEDNSKIAIDYKASPEIAKTPWVDAGDLFQNLWIQSSDDARNAGLKMDVDGKYHWMPGMGPCRWRPSIHMPRWASRLTLRITDVRVERVQEISGEDAMAEGYGNDGCEGNSALRWFRRLWDSINAKRGYSWDSNPWVWVIEWDKPIRRNVDEVV